MKKSRRRKAPHVDMSVEFVADNQDDSTGADVCETCGCTRDTHEEGVGPCVCKKCRRFRG